MYLLQYLSFKITVLLLYLSFKIQPTTTLLKQHYEAIYVVLY